MNSDRLFSPDSSTNKTDCLDITELLLKVVLNPIKITPLIYDIITMVMPNKWKFNGVSSKSQWFLNLVTMVLHRFLFT
jgi:hypothetical protein